ncbi:ribonucleotide reductase inhibitor-domain-containing protein [Pyrenochaeta sp. MPI-SDFR-AT-0127]|nr:ribonucleotide reductase inhibitor-domain-containing protein [Pyrenochaeta sp. MPI-SDFR-AT-0127]
MHMRDSSTEHRTKRKFQPSITSYFAQRDDFDDFEDPRGQDPITRPRQQQRESLAPQVPGHVQADLLSVGMRVRKSVPEGYKTQKMSALPSIQTTLSKPAVLDALETKPPRDPVPDDFVHQRELLPFCGLHKIGGLGFAEQPTTNIHLYGGLDSTGSRASNLFPLPAEAFTQPFSSQGSADSGYSTSSQRLPNPLNPSKRSWQDDDDKPLNTNFFFSISMKGLGTGAAEMDDAPVSPLSETPPQSINMLPAVRQFAQPKSRRAARGVLNDEDMDMDFENAERMEGRVAVGSGSDFEEADFLASEVDMGGI